MQPERNPIAVIVPTYNRVDALSECLRHLENQTWKRFEMVVVDDGSTDSTPEFLEAYAHTNRLRLRYVRQQNAGPARARNLAISLIEAPLCLMIGDDIFASPELVETHLRLHHRYPDLSVAVLGLTQWSETGQQVTPFMRWMDSQGMQFDYGHLLSGREPDWRHFYTSNLSLKTELLKRFPFDESFPHAAMEDVELACRIEELHGLEVKFAPAALAYHFHPVSFAQACRRMIRVGESTAHFYAKWPSKVPQHRRSVTRALKTVMISVPGTLPVFKELANASLKITCPNPLMKFVLGCYFTAGYRRSVKNRRAEDQSGLHYNEAKSNTEGN